MLDADSISLEHPSLRMEKDTQKAIAVIIGALLVLVALLLWANYLRPHGI